MHFDVSANATKNVIFLICWYLGVARGIWGYLGVSRGKTNKKALNKQKSNNARIKYLDRNVDG